MAGDLRHRRDGAPGAGREDAADIALTCACDGAEHVVDGEADAAALVSGAGVYRAVCGWLVLPASMGVARGRPCPRCAELGATRPPQAERRARLRATVGGMRVRLGWAR